MNALDTALLELNEKDYEFKYITIPLDDFGDFTGYEDVWPNIYMNLSVNIPRKEIKIMYHQISSNPAAFEGKRLICDNKGLKTITRQIESIQPHKYDIGLNIVYLK